MSQTRVLSPVEISGPAGRLSALLHRPAGEIRFVGVVSHPHPLFGGTMDNKVAYRVARALEASGGLVARYDFRGVRRSEGTHDHGIGEQDDARAVLAFARERAWDLAGRRDLPAILAGFSFGSVISSRVAAKGDADVGSLLLVGAPVLTHGFGELREKPAGLRVACVQGSRDEHGPMPELHAAWSGIAEPKRLVVIEGAGHFFDGEQQQLFDAVTGLASGFFGLA